MASDQRATSRAPTLWQLLPHGKFCHNLPVASLREKKKARTAATIAGAALDLFAERGFASVTIADVAAAAGVGERTVYRYFPDKEELLFAEDPGWRDALRLALAARPANERPYAALLAASVAVTRALNHRRDEMIRRAAIIAAAPPLQARERSKRTAWEEVLADGLRQRDVPAAQARLLARAAVACFDESVARWLGEDPPQRGLDTHLAATFAELRANLTA